MRIQNGIRLVALLALAAHGVAAQPTTPVKLAKAESSVDFEFSAIVGVRELADGRLLVSDRVERKLFVTDFQAKTVTQVGRLGKGPGEYENADWIFSIGGDSTLLLERPAMRWHLFYRTSLVKTITASDPVFMAVRRLASGADSRGNVIRVYANFSEKTTLADAESSVVIRGNRRSGRVDTIATLRNVKTELRTETAQRRVVSIARPRVPFAAGDEVAMFEDGWIAVVRADPYRVDWIDATGKALPGARLPWTGTQVTVEDVQLSLRQTGRRIEPDALKDEAAHFMAKVPAVVPAVKPGGVIPLGDGTLLIQNPSTARNPDARYHIVNRRGQLAGSLAMRPGERVVAATAKWAYVITTDSDGLQRLSRHR